MTTDNNTRLVTELRRVYEQRGTLETSSMWKDIKATIEEWYLRELNYRFETPLNQIPVPPNSDTWEKFVSMGRRGLITREGEARIDTEDAQRGGL